MVRPSNFDVYAQLDQYVSQEDITRIKAELVACPEINTNLCGTICELSKDHAKSVFITTPEMVIDEQGLILDAFVFSAANYVAQAAINKEFSVLISSRSSFYAPLKFGDTLMLEAQALFDENSKKREVRVVGYVKDIKVYEASMQVVVTDEHIFKLKRPPSNINNQNANQQQEQAQAAGIAEAMNLANLAGLAGLAK